MSSIKHILFLAIASCNFFLSTAEILSWNLDQWIDQCNGLQTNRTDGGCRRIKNIAISDSAFETDKDLAWKSFLQPLEETMQLMVTQLRQADWLKGMPECVRKPKLKITAKTKFPFAPFAQKLDLEPGDEVIFHGDFHGDCHSFVNELERLKADGYLDDNFKIIKPGVYMVFLGDYVDRGLHGVEVIYTILRLKLANPDNVFMVRGNHEELVMNQVESMGFAQECRVKFGGSADSRASTIARLYEIMPVVLYVGCGDNYLQCCHGGMEPGYNPSKLLNGSKKFQLLGSLKRETLRYRNRDGSFTGTPEFTPHASFSGENEFIGFMWHDFIEHKLDNTIVCRPGRGLAFAKGAVEKLLSRQNKGQRSVRGVFRGHQHSASRKSDPFNLMHGLIESRGVYKLWAEDFETALAPESRTVSDGLVWTFNVAPDSHFGVGCDFNFDAYAILTVALDYDEWSLQVFNTETLVLEERACRFTGDLLNTSVDGLSDIEADKVAIDFNARLGAIEARLNQIEASYGSFKDRFDSLNEDEDSDQGGFLLEQPGGGGGAAKKAVEFSDRLKEVKEKLNVAHSQLSLFIGAFDSNFEMSEDENVCKLDSVGMAALLDSIVDQDELLNITETEQLIAAEDFLKMINDMYDYIECRFEEQGAF
jgi:hypothetical protein